MSSETLNAVARRYLADMRSVSPGAAVVIERVFPNAVDVLASAIECIDITSISSPDVEYLYVMPDGTSYTASCDVEPAGSSGSLASLAAFKPAL